MQYVLALFGALFFIALQIMFIILKLTGQWAIGWGVVLIPCWFICLFFFVALLIWLFVLFM